MKRRLGPTTILAIMTQGLLALAYSSMMAASSEPEDLLETMRRSVRWRQWERANKGLAKVERERLCHGAVCLAARAIITAGQGEVNKAGQLARQAVKLFEENHGLSAWELNELGVLLYRTASGKEEVLNEAESAFRHAQAVYSGEASNIRYNLATLLRDLGREEEGNEMMEQLESSGLLIQPGMSILAEFHPPGREQ